MKQTKEFMERRKLRIRYNLAITKIMKLHPDIKMYKMDPNEFVKMAEVIWAENAAKELGGEL